MRYKIHSNYNLAGGQHANHQLAYLLESIGEDASLVYPPNPETTTIVPLFQQKYGLTKFDNRDLLHDDPDIVHILPAGWGAAYLPFDKATNFCLKLKGNNPHKSKKVFWWLGIGPWQDWDRGGYDKEVNLEHPNLKKALHGCQSRTAYDFLIASGEIPQNQIFMLRDFTDPIFVPPDDSHIFNPNRQNKILYNGSKSIELTQKIIQACQNLDCEFIKLKDMTPEQIKELALNSKIYIDFSQHGGKDRLPREMASLGLSIITGSDGAAFNTVDVPVGQRKFRRAYNGEYNIESIKNLIELDLKDHNKAFFDPHLVKYRQSIREERQQALLDTRHMVELLSS